MRKLERTGQFRHDYKREARGQHRTTLDADLVPILVALADDQSLEPRHHDHALSGDWKVSGNWRIVFRFVAGEAVDVDLISDHWLE